MKKILLFFCLFLNSIVLHGMEVSSAVSSDKKSGNSKKIMLQNDFKNFLAHRLESYKKNFLSPEDMQHIQTMYGMTLQKNMSFLGDCLHKEACDEKGDNFIHCAAKNRDVRVIEWAIKFMKHPLSIPNKLGKEPIDLCIDQLMPHESENNKENAYKAFTVLADGYGIVGFDYENRRRFLKKIVTLEFEYIKQGIPFTFKVDDVLKCFSREDIQLSEVYQEVRDEEGNTFTHMLVSHHLPDLLYTFLINNYITLAANNNNENPLTLAQKNFLSLGHNLFEQSVLNKDFDIAKISQEDNKKKCCYWMLLNLQKKKAKNTDFKQCCDKHTVEEN
jgi:hypothetical protein